MAKIDYKDAGVDVQKADAFVERIKNLVPTTFNENVMDGIGGFAAVYKLNDEKYLASCTDGVGTKLKLAQALNIHHGIGIDLVAMCVNDLLCVGAKPLFFLDYMAFGKLDTKVSEELIAGMVDGCSQSGMALIGGETAEMPGLYKDGEYDLAGFSVGELSPSEMFTDEGMEDGDALIGLASSGFHSNGYSLLRQLVNESEESLLKDLLVPTKIYVRTFQRLRQKFSQGLLAAAHMTGGGVDNIPRMSERFDYDLQSWPRLEELPSIFGEIVTRSQLPVEELFKTFNMGVGMTLVIKKSIVAEVLQFLKEEGTRAWHIGSIKKGQGQVKLPENWV